MTMVGLIVALVGCLVVQAFFAASEIHWFQRTI